MEIAALKLDANHRIGSREFDEAARILAKAVGLAGQVAQSDEIVAELADLGYIRRFLDSRQYATASKHAYYQSHQRSHSKTSYSSGRDTR